MNNDWTDEMAKRIGWLIIRDNEALALNLWKKVLEEKNKVIEKNSIYRDQEKLTEYYQSIRNNWKEWFKDVKETKYV